jgi:hypothetical protein
MITRDDALMKNVEKQNISARTWDVRQALMDMASNLDQPYVLGSIERNHEICYVEDTIDTVINELYDSFESELQTYKDKLGGEVIAEFEGFSSTSEIAETNVLQIPNTNRQFINNSYLHLPTEVKGTYKVLVIQND